MIAPNFTGANLSGAVLRHVDFSYGRFFRRQSLRRIVEKCQPCQCDLSGADLTGADVSETNFEGANLTGAKGLDTLKACPRPATSTGRCDRELADVKPGLGIMAAIAAVLAAGVAVTAPRTPTAAQDMQAADVDTALIVSVDVSNSVDENRYRLQMEGIAKALEDESVVNAIAGGRGRRHPVFDGDMGRPPGGRRAVDADHRQGERGGACRQDPQAAAAGREFTCMTKMLRSVNDKIVPQIPGKRAGSLSMFRAMDLTTATPMNRSTRSVTSLSPAASRSTACRSWSSRNPGKEQMPLPGAGGLSVEEWYRAHVMAGPGAFVLPAEGYGDFGRAIRQKFIVEISGITPAQRYSARSLVGTEGLE
jgi:hypothetical protein